MIYLKLFFEFFKVGLFAIGGGIAGIPFLYEMAFHKNWFTLQELINMIAISEATPGPIGINMATYVGYITTNSFIGGIISSLGETLPSIISILVIASFLRRYKDSIYVKKTFEIIRPVVFGTIVSIFIGIILNSVFKIEDYNLTKNIKDLFDIRYIIIFITILVINLKVKKIHPIFLITFSALLAVILSI